MNIPTVPVHLKLAVSVPEAAALVSMSPSTIRRLVLQGVLPTVPHTSRTLIPRAALERFVDTTTGSAA